MSSDTRTYRALLVRVLGLFLAAASTSAAAQERAAPRKATIAAAPAPQDLETSGSGPPATQEAEPAAGRTLDLSNPRATMAAFLNAIDEAERGNIERYVDALACLDLSGLAELPEEARAPRGRKLASLLNAFVGKHGVELELIPDTPKGEPYAYHKTEDGKAAIELAPDADGVWRFTWASMEFIESPPPEAGAPEAAPQAVKPPPAPPAQPAPAEVEPPAEVSKEHRSAQATMRTFLAAMRAGRFAEAAKCLDLSSVPQVARSEKGEELALYLHRAIKWTKDVVPSVISDDPGDAPYIFRSPEDKLGVIVIARQGDDAERPGHWLFTQETVAGLDALYEALQESGAQVKGDREAPEVTIPLKLRFRERIPRSLKNTWFLLKHYQWLGLAVVLLLGRFARRLTTFLLRFVTGLWLSRTGVQVDEGVQAGTFKPVGILAASAVWWLGLTWLALPAGVLAVLLTAVKFVACWATVWTAYRAVDLLTYFASSLAEKTHTKLDDMLIPFVRKAAKTLVTIFGVYFIISMFTEPPTHLLAGLGLGGLAFALAAQDTIRNLFGSLTVILDRPFKVGDWVVIGDVDGTVESVGFRSTRVRTFYNSQMVVPNATLMNATVDNYGARRYRRAKTTLSLTYATPPDKIDAFCEGIRELIRLHPYTRKDYYHVYLNQFAASSLDILLYVFFEVPDWSTELRERHRLFVDILRLADKLGVEFAFPTQTVWLERSRDRAAAPDQAPFVPGRDDPESAGQGVAAKVFEEAYGVPPVQRGPVVIDSAPRFRRRAAPSDDGSPQS